MNVSLLSMLKTGWLGEFRPGWLEHDVVKRLCPSAQVDPLTDTLLCGGLRISTREVLASRDEIMAVYGGAVPGLDEVGFVGERGLVRICDEFEVQARIVGGARTVLLPSQCHVVDWGLWPDMRPAEVEAFLADNGITYRRLSDDPLMYVILNNEQADTYKVILMFSGVDPYLDVSVGFELYTDDGIEIRVPGVMNFPQEGLVRFSLPHSPDL